MGYYACYIIPASLLDRELHCAVEAQYLRFLFIAGR